MGNGYDSSTSRLCNILTRINLIMGNCKTNYTSLPLVQAYDIPYNTIQKTWNLLASTAFSNISHICYTSSFMFVAYPNYSLPLGSSSDRETTAGFQKLGHFFPGQVAFERIGVWRYFLQLFSWEKGSA